MANTNSALANIANPPANPQVGHWQMGGKGPPPLGIGQPQQRVPVRPPGPDTRPFGGPQTPFARSDLNLGGEASALPPGVVERNGRLYNRRGVPLNARTARQIKNRYQQTQRAGQLRQERAATAQELGRSTLSTRQLQAVRDLRASNPETTVEQQNQMIEQKAAEQKARDDALMARVPVVQQQRLDSYEQQLESARGQHDIEIRNRELREQLNSPDPRVRWNAQQELSKGPGIYSQDQTTHYEDLKANRDSMMRRMVESGNMDPVQYQEQNEIAEFERRLSEITRNHERALRTGDWTVDPNELKELFSELYDKGLTTDLNGNVIPMGGGGPSAPTDPASPAPAPVPHTMPEPGSIPQVAAGPVGMGSVASAISAAVGGAAMAAPGGNPAQRSFEAGAAGRKQSFEAGVEGRKQSFDAKIAGLENQLGSDITEARRKVIRDKINEAKVAYEAGEKERRSKFELGEAERLERYNAKNPADPNAVPPMTPQVATPASPPSQQPASGPRPPLTAAGGEPFTYSQGPRPPLAATGGQPPAQPQPPARPDVSGWHNVGPDPSSHGLGDDKEFFHPDPSSVQWGQRTPGAMWQPLDINPEVWDKSFVPQEGGLSLYDQYQQESGVNLEELRPKSEGGTGQGASDYRVWEKARDDYANYVRQKSGSDPLQEFQSRVPTRYQEDAINRGLLQDPSAFPTPTVADQPRVPTTPTTPTAPTAPTTPTSPTEEPFVGPIDIRSKFSKWLDTRKSPEDFRKEMMKNIAEGDKRMLARHAPPPPPGQPQPTFEQQAQRGATMITLQQGMLELQKTQVEIQNLIREGKIDPHQQAKIDAQLKMAEAVGTILQSAAGGGHMSPEQLEQMLSSFMGALQVASKETNPPPNPKKNPDDPTGKDDPTAIPSPNPVPTRKPTSPASGRTRKPTSAGRMSKPTGNVPGYGSFT